MTGPVKILLLLLLLLMMRKTMMMRRRRRRNSMMMMMMMMTTMMTMALMRMIMMIMRMNKIVFCVHLFYLYFCFRSISSLHTFILLSISLSPTHPLFSSIFVFVRPTPTLLSIPSFSAPLSIVFIFSDFLSLPFSFFLPLRSSTSLYTSLEFKSIEGRKLR